KVKRCAGCALGSKTSKTLKRVRETRKGYRIIEHVKREELFEIHTPQVFKKDVIMRAYTRFFNKDALDDAQIVSRAGYDVYIVEGSHMNIKITYPQDLVMAREVLG
ncbi:MAG: 2-C-methyl-D-erythritol 4-phosphate cytidylyltransferase, partial [Deltaproteobacteria bacterium]|nr:2-C-methyl-D-erythritol 4-phosphate cytidylyltransferase [Deltaproteobacteria bacterium]